MTIEQTDEMTNAVRAFAPAPCSVKQAKRMLVAVLAIVERDYRLIPLCPEELMPGVRCLRQDHACEGEHEGILPTGSTVKWS